VEQRSIDDAEDRRIGRDYTSFAPIPFKITTRVA
jgi:hypothetical protein